MAQQMTSTPTNPLIMPTQGMHASKMNGGLGRFGFMAQPRQPMSGTVQVPKIDKVQSPRF